MSVLGHRWPHAHAEGWNAVDLPGLVTMAVLALVLWFAINVLQAPILFPPATHSGQSSRGSFQSPACSELARLRSHGVTRGAQVDRLLVACRRSTARP
jgi:hypothetical protein